ncbi:MAG: lipid A deacylase LpxR family protein [Ferruginibacter sp.]|nr:lipid A deacylase LpxR family protein [Chitinophagaceae bacterium]
MVGLVVVAQQVDNSSSFRKINAKSYFRFFYDNDFFANRDYYYTQGITFEYVHPSFENFPVSKLLYKSKNSTTQYGITFNLFGYTPTSIKTDAILYGDRPFEGSLSLKIFANSLNTSRRERIASALSAGIIGPAALGKEIQTNIHRWTGNLSPKGWQHQVRNDLLLNYQLNVEKNWLVTGNFILNGTAELRAGTLHNRIGGGINFMAGHFNNPFKEKDDKKVSFYFYGQGRINLIGYDATMQGGLFNHKSPYIIPAGDISRITVQADAGLVLHFKKLYLGYSQSFLTKEFRTGINHRWGGISTGFAF